MPDTDASRIVGQAPTPSPPAAQAVPLPRQRDFEPDAGGPGDVDDWLDARRVLPLPVLLMVGGLAHGFGMALAPLASRSERAQVTTAYTLDRLGALTDPALWPAGVSATSLHVAAWAWLTQAFERVPTTVGAGRELMLVAHLVACALLWALARRLGAAPAAAAVAVVLFTLPPTVLEATRVVDPANLGNVYFLTALLFACSARSLALSIPGALVALAVTAVTSPSHLFLLPVVVGLFWWKRRGGLEEQDDFGTSRAGPPLRALPLVAAAGIVGVVGIALFPADRPGLVVVLPLLALLPALAGQALWAYWARRLESSDSVGPGVVPLLATVLVVLAGLGAFGASSGRLAELWSGSGGVPGRALAQWVNAHVEPGARILTDVSTRAELLRAGQPATDIGAYDDQSVGRAADDPAQWAGYDYVLLTGDRNGAPFVEPPRTLPLADSAYVSGFATGQVSVELRRLEVPPPVTRKPDNGAKSDPAAQPAGSQAGLPARKAAGRALARNDRVALSPQARDALVAGAVDVRLMTVLAVLSGEHSVSVSGFGPGSPAAPGEPAAGAPLGSAEIVAIDGVPVNADSALTAEVTSWLEAQTSYRPTSSYLRGEPQRALVITYGPPSTAEEEPDLP